MNPMPTRRPCVSANCSTTSIAEPATCRRGLGSNDTGPPIAGSPITLAAEPEALINMTLYGAEYPPTSPSSVWEERRQWDQMEAYGRKLNDENAAALLTYIRSAWGNDASEVTPKQVAAQR